MSENIITPTETSAQPPPPMAVLHTSRIVGVKFRMVGKVYDFDAGTQRFLRGDKVVCDFEDQGAVLGFVSKPSLAVESETFKINLPPVLRVANNADIETREKHVTQEKEALTYIAKMIEERKLPMRVVSVDIPLSRKKVLVYFTSEDRIDFRDLVQDLAKYFKNRVELRQLGARDETKYIGGIGPCGQETCCSRFLKSFHAVNIKMAKDQQLSLNPTKVTGNCGRLKCCLAYEQPAYAEAKKTLPKLGNCVKCSSGGDGKGEGCGIVVKLDVLKQLVLVRFDDGTYDNVPVGRILEEQTITKKKDQSYKVVAQKEAEVDPSESVDDE